MAVAVLEQISPSAFIDSMSMDINVSRPSPTCWAPTLLSPRLPGHKKCTLRESDRSRSGLQSPHRSSVRVFLFRTCCPRRNRLNCHGCTWISEPVVLDLIEIFAVEGLEKSFGSFVVEGSGAMKLSLNPHAIVGWLTLAVVEHSSAVDLVILELTLVKGSILKGQSSLTLFLTIDHLTSIVMTLLVDKLTISHTFLLYTTFLLDFLRNLMLLQRPKTSKNYF